MISIAGDLHGDMQELTAYIRKKKPVLVIQLGDFGFWPNATRFRDIEDIKSPVWFIDGNHENHMALAKHIHPIVKGCGVEYLPRATVRDLPTGERALFMGGAASIDKHLRTPGYDWFSEETICERDMEKLPDTDIEVVFSHTCPDFILKQVLRKCKGKSELKDPSTTYLQQVHDRYKPHTWYFGHWHKSFEINYAGTQFHCLDIQEIKEFEA